MKILRDVFAVFFPEACLSCGEYLATHETVICLNCRHDLPLTNFSFEKDNLIEKSFYGRIPLEKATSLFYFFKKGNVQRLIHELKYNKQQQVGTFIGDWLGEQLVESGRFDTIDCIIPVPLHPKKLKKRGYNQVTTFGESLSKKMVIPYLENILIRVSSTKTQTKKMRLERWKNVQELFHVQNNAALENKHILLIDDVITTGATLEACYDALSQTKNLKISIACMAYTK